MSKRPTRDNAVAAESREADVPEFAPRPLRQKRRFIWPVALAAVLSLASWTIAQAATLPPLPVDNSSAGTLVADAPQAPVDAPVPSAAPLAFGPQLQVILPPPPPPPPPAPGQGTAAQWCDGKYGATASASSLDGLLAAANAERARFGLGALSWSSSLAGSAQDWSNAMAAVYDPGNPGAALSHGMLPSPGGQNVAAAWTSGASMSQSSAISRAHSGWMASPGHCTNILRASFTTMGAGTAQSADGKAWYSTVDFQ